VARKPLGLVVADASVVVAALAPAQAAGDWAVSVLARPRRVAPRLMPFEVATAFRRMQLSN
jgi:predicted nucleic acid-binding protein